ncbi:hypothetical protein FPQ10_06050 [Allobacillus sp. SKP2-8]|uniref:hypothetical protein n=1 Tax=unclassified Allobacillus TaxID=2628859 RepID=UPI001182F8DF|nr:hypothetical protein [Allobacillus sp. SKP2-8]TSJ67357.1 hypothetical protein FPQ10_06050 [Allobacillus sp. SKP2-8]
MSKFVESLDEFLSLNYKLEIVPFEEEGEKGVVVKSPEINGLEVYGDTIEEALAEVDESKKALYSLYKEKGWVIKYPNEYSQEKDNFSGRTTIRMPKTLHRRVYEYSQQCDVSLNAGIVQLLNDGLKEQEMEQLREDILDKISKMNKDIK